MEVREFQDTKITDEVVLEAFSRKAREEDSICPFLGATNEKRTRFSNFTYVSGANTSGEASRVSYSSVSQSSDGGVGTILPSGGM
ncbi:unnamed protein product [Heterotrigona itama]|uniref:Uncharacterized protein n=1 Tax=Heterotrigona itama TaxID=395501 RepID=A0A6V7GYW2_9HYME|nr:unnamed protein product [Heterotrigona itama]